MKFYSLKSAVALSVVIALVAIAAVNVSAQGRYTGKYSKRDVNNIIKKVEESSDKFRTEFDRQLDNSNLNGTREEDRLNRIVANYEAAIDRLRNQFDMTDNWWQSRNNVQAVMSEARQLNAMMNNLSFARKIERQWNQMRKDINKLADTYDFPDLAGGGYSPVPSWAVGTFYSRNPQTGGNITLAISSDGQVVVTFENGQTNIASINGDQFNNNGIFSRVTQISGGIRTTRMDNGESIDYFRDGGLGGNGSGNSGGIAPSWAVGAFTARNPQTGGYVTLTIAPNGSVVVTADGNRSFATISGDRLNNNGIIARVTRIRNGIRTTRLDNGEAIDYYQDNGTGVQPVQGGNVPNWAVGRFFGRNPQTGGVIVLDIASNGNVTITIDNGQPTYATMSGDRLFNDGIEARVTKTRNGIRTTRIDNGESIDYRK